MNDQLKALLELQKIDSDLFLMWDLKEKRPLEMEKERQRLREAEHSVARIQEGIKKIRVECDHGELELKNNQAELEKLGISLNLAKTNEEYQVFKTQIERLSEDNSGIEELVLNKLNEVDALNEEKKSAEQMVEVVRKELAEKQRELDQFLEELGQRIERLQGERTKAVSRVKPDSLEIYNRVLQRYSDSALAPVENKVCQGCHMSVTNQSINRLMLGAELVQCQSCVRILYLEDGEG